MIEGCLFRDTVVSKFYNKAHCGLRYTEIGEKYYKEYCCTSNFRECAYIEELYEKISNDNEY